MSWIVHAFYFSMIYRRTDTKTTSPSTKFCVLSYETNRLRVVVRLYSERSQRMSKCDEDISDLRCASGTTFFVPTTFWHHLWPITELMHGIQGDKFLKKSVVLHLRDRTTGSSREPWRRANARNVSFETLYSGWITLSTQLIILN